METQINKIKYDRKTGQVVIEYGNIRNDIDDDIKIVLKSSDKPLPEFIENLNALSPHVEIICELNEGYCSQAEIRGVSFSHTNGIMGAVITALVPITSANSPVVINTPHLPSDQYSDGGSSPVLEPGCVFLLKNLILLAKKYIGGERDRAEQTKIEFDL